jgi:hypothetical protein
MNSTSFFSEKLGKDHDGARKVSKLSAGAADQTTRRPKLDRKQMIGCLKYEGENVPIMQVRKRAYQTYKQKTF